MPICMSASKLYKVRKLIHFRLPVPAYLSVHFPEIYAILSFERRAWDHPLLRFQGVQSPFEGATMPTYTYGQREPMENEAMAKNLDAQARAIWPQEKAFLPRLFIRQPMDVLDVG